MNNKTAAAKLNKIANGYAAKHYGYPDDADYQNMLVDDTEDLRAIASLIANGDLGAALRKAEYLDTAVRDEIPDKVWSLLTGKADA
jgi:hypothetical protein